MSYSVYVQKLKNGDSDFEPFSNVERILGKWGKIVDGVHGYEFVPSSNSICEICSVFGNPEEGISGLSFGRPSDDESFPDIIFDLLGIENTCFFGTDLEFILSRSKMDAHYPEEMTASATPIVITNARDHWPF